MRSGDIGHVLGDDEVDELEAVLAAEHLARFPELCEVQRGPQGDPVGVMVWMHTFSPAKMWIPALTQLNKPLLQFHTQFNKDLPWGEIDMDFMNMNQAAHGDREHGFIMTRLRIARKVVVGFWQEAETQEKIGAWARAADMAAGSNAADRKSVV